MSSVLIVDDKEENLYYLAALFAGHGYAVTTAQHGAEALVKARQSSPDLVISDLLMPVMDGYTLLRHWKSDTRLRRIPFIVYTATYTEAEDEQLARSLGADAFILKPAEPDVFLAQVREIQARAEAAEPSAADSPSGNESDLMQVYSKTLIRKLEQKSLQLEEANRALKEDIAERQRIQDSLREAEHEQRQLAQQLEIERSRLIAAQRVAKVGSWETDIASLQVMWSEETHRIHETDPATFQPTHQGFLALVHPEDRARVDEAFVRSLDQHDACAIEHRLLLPDGRIKCIEERWQMLFDAQGSPIRAIGTCQDISDRKLAEMALQESTLKIERLNRVYAVLSQINALIVRARNRDELFDEACRIVVEHGGFRMAMICVAEPGTGKIIPIASAGKDPKLMTAVRSLLVSAERAADTLVAHVMREKAAYVANDSCSDPRILLSGLYADYGVRSLVALPLIVADEAVGVLVLYAGETDFFHAEEMKLLSELAGDVAYAIDHIWKQERLDYLAYYDALTGLANRTLFLERVAQYLRSGAINGHKLALFLFDLERFKNINDSLGRTAGDALLQQVAQWMSRNARDPNLLARVGADHFAFVLPDVRPERDLARLLEETLDRFVEHPFQLDGHTFRIAAKAGVALFPDDGDNVDTLFKHAEAALKEAKSSGERYVFFDKAMSERVADNLTLENQLRQARGNDEFVLHYQPKINLKSGQVTGTEALIRWNNPRTGLVPPNQFIPVLEETGLIHDVGRWALRKAIADYLRWRDSGLAAVRIAVNVSPLQLRNRGFIDEIKQLISVDPRAAAGLELEITESMVMENVEHGIATLRAIRALGVHITIDDFGTGFSSLSYLSRLPLDVLKIDRSFVHDMTTGPDGFSVVSNIITLAHSLKLNVVAEGVETEEQSRLLRSLACDEIQGFLFSRPVASDLFEARFLSQPAGG
jgi:diguanylate cyclase (GGDEF)-like protein